MKEALCIVWSDGFVSFVTEDEATARYLSGQAAHFGTVEVLQMTSIAAQAAPGLLLQESEVYRHLCQFIGSISIKMSDIIQSFPAFRILRNKSNLPFSYLVTMRPLIIV